MIVDVTHKARGLFIDQDLRKKIQFSSRKITWDVLKLMFHWQFDNVEKCTVWLSSCDTLALAMCINGLLLTNMEDGGEQ